MIKVLVTGANGQLGSEIKEITANSSDYIFDFTDANSLDISSKEQVEEYFAKNDVDYCINCAAYTAVDKSEENVELAHLVNTTGPANLAKACLGHDVTLIHVSTDFVFNGETNLPYRETDTPAPINVYGRTKLDGEIAVQSILQNYFIIRTSWLYSSYGNNFVKTMLRLSHNKNSLGVIDDQIGTPTYAADLAIVIIDIIKTKNEQYGLYHYSNEGVASWYDLAQAIFEYSKIDIELKPITTKEYPLPAKRPVFTVMNKRKMKDKMKISIPHWRESLEECLKIINR